MYWPVGTPRIYASSSSQSAERNASLSHDGLPLATPDEKDADKSDQASLLTADSASSIDFPYPATPITPMTPAIQPVERDILDTGSEPASVYDSEVQDVPFKEPILALRVSRLGQIFAVITATSMTIWQAKVRPPLLQSHWIALY